MVRSMGVRPRLFPPASLISARTFLISLWLVVRCYSDEPAGPGKGKFVYGSDTFDPEWRRGASGGATRRLAGGYFLYSERSAG